MHKDLGPRTEPDDASCAQWLSDGLHDLGRSLAHPAGNHPPPPGPRDLAEWSEALEHHLLDSQLNDALQTLNAFARQRHPDAVLPELMVATIRRLERLWGSDLVSESTLTLAFATARHLIDVWKSQNRPRGRDPRRLPARHPVLVCVAPGDQHTFGAQILSDDLMLRGWGVDLLLSSRPETFLDRVTTKPYSAVMVSLGQDGSLADLGNLIANMRRVSARRDVLILIGGSGLAQPFEQYHFLGADLIAGTAAQGADFLTSRLSQSLAQSRN